jgi:nucleoside phosphorylase/CheY-like chemotaxis protein
VIKILIVDDNADKISNIKELILRFKEISPDDIKTAPASNEAKRIIAEYQFDLLILDLMLPENFGDNPKDTVGIDLLNELKLNPNTIPPFHVIGLTAFSELNVKYSKEFKDYLWSLITYDNTTNNWSIQLENKISYLIHSKKEINNPSNIKYNYDVAIITALISPELDKILAIDANWSLCPFQNDSTEYHIGFIDIGTKRIKLVAASAAQMGMCAASTLSMKMINCFRPKYIFMSGIAAGIRGEGNFGDILVADQVWDAASGKLKTTEKGKNVFLPDYKCKTLNSDIREELVNLASKRTYLDEIKNSWPANKPQSSLNMHIGPMASIPAVIQNKKYIDELKKHSRKLIGIEMESYGMFYSADHCTKPKPIPVSIKSICDFADSEKNDIYQDYAAYTSANFIFNYLTNHLFK